MKGSGWTAALPQGVRVEVNGQVLSQGGNLGADRIADTTTRVQHRSNANFLPAAVIVGLRPGAPLQVNSRSPHPTLPGGLACKVHATENCFCTMGRQYCQPFNEHISVEIPGRLD